MKLNVKRELKFFGKFLTYLSMVGAIVLLVKGDYEFSMLSLLMMFVGCAIHEYSEDL